MSDFNEEAMNDSLHVEEAPDSVDLDALLGINAEDLGKDEKLDNDTYAEAEEKIEVPHFKVSARKFNEALRISNIVSQGAGKDVIGKAIGLEVKGGDLQIYLTDFDVFVEKSVSIINTENILTDFISVNLTIISKLIKACSSVLTIYKKDDKYYIKLIGGDMELETIKVDKDRMVIKDRNKFTKTGELSTETFCKVIKSMFVLANAGVTANQRKIFLQGNQFIDVFLYCAGTYTNDEELPEMDLKIKDMKILYSLAIGSEAKTLVVSKNKDRVVVEGNNFMFSFMTSTVKPSQQLLNSMPEIIDREKVNVDYVQLSKITDLSAELMYSTSKLIFNYTEDGKISCILQTKRSDSTFVLRGQVNSKVIPMEKPVAIQSALLRTLLRFFSAESTIALSLSDKGIGLVSGKYQAVLYTEA